MNELAYAISPFAHVPKVLLAEQVVVAPLVALLGIAALLAVAGVIGFRRRDLGQSLVRCRK